MKSKDTPCYNQKYLQKFSDSLRTDNHRYLSWQHCYMKFRKLPNLGRCSSWLKDNLSLHLGFYLGSWGMMRGSTSLLQRDYKIHLKALPILEKYAGLRMNNDEVFSVERRDKIMKCFAELHTYYTSVGVSATDTLLTKIMLGTLGCVPAFDRCFQAGFTNGGAMKVNSKNLERVFIFAQNNCKELIDFRKKTNIIATYPLMKLVDMHFFIKGEEGKS